MLGEIIDPPHCGNVDPDPTDRSTLVPAGRHIDFLRGIVRRQPLRAQRGDCVITSRNIPGHLLEPVCAADGRRAGLRPAVRTDLQHEDRNEQDSEPQTPVVLLRDAL
jgi:hypothetical protein